MIEFLVVGIYGILFIELLTIIGLERNRNLSVAYSLVTLFSLASMSYFIKNDPVMGYHFALIIGAFPLGFLSKHIWSNLRKPKKR